MAITKIPAAGFTGNNFRNIIINGDMSIAQRGTSQSGVGASDTYLIDRFQLDTNGGVTARFTMSQNTDVPTGQGFSKSLKLDCTTAQTSLGSFHALALMQKFEGQNVQYLKYGTSSAESLTCSFWVKSAKTGTYILEIDADDNGRNINQSYTINSANTWEKKTLTFVGDTASALANDNSNELEVYFWLMASSDFTSGTLQTSWGSTVNANRAVGQINLGDSTSNDFYITGVQLEAGTSASDFEFLPVDVNKRRCLRYYELLASGDNQVLFDAFYYTATEIRHAVHPQVPMRANPTLDQTSGTDYYRFIRDAANDKFDDFSLDISTPTAVEFFNSTDMSGVQGESGWCRTDVASSFVALDAEL